MKISDQKRREIQEMIGHAVEVHHYGGEHHGQLVHADDEALHLYVREIEATNEEKSVRIKLKEVVSVVRQRQEASFERKSPTMLAVA